MLGAGKVAYSIIALFRDSTCSRDDTGITNVYAAHCMDDYKRVYEEESGTSRVKRARVL